MPTRAQKRTVDLANLLEQYLEEDHLGRLGIEEVEARRLEAEIESLALELREAALEE